MKKLFKFVASRKLLFSEIGSQNKAPFELKVGHPYLLKRGDVNFEFSEGAAGCDLLMDGLSDETITSFGADTVQALEIALQFDKTLRRLSSKYQFYFPSGEPYFEGLT